MRSDPPRSLPSSRAVRPAAIAAAEPPDDPPGVRAEVPGVVGGAEEVVVGLGVARELGQVRLAEDDRAGGAQAGDGVRVAYGDVVGERRRAGGRADAGGLEAVLDGDRQSVQRAGRLAPCQRAIGRDRVGEGALGVEGHHRVQRGVVALDPAEVALEEFAAGELPPRQRSRRARSRRRTGRTARLDSASLSSPPSRPHRNRSSRIVVHAPHSTDVRRTGRRRHDAADARRYAFAGKPHVTACVRRPPAARTPRCRRPSRSSPSP